MILRDLEEIFKSVVSHVNPAYLSVDVFCGKRLSHVLFSDFFLLLILSG